MYAVFQASGRQFKVKEGDTLKLDTLEGDPGSSVTFDKVLLLGGDDAIKVGSPTVSGASVQCEIVDHGRARKVIVFKYKRRKGYQVKRGHRQHYTKVRVTKISA
ncbi:50S ribosomal protein L21 [bacterium]|nr:50S ribosomal protein L21 [bacterium]